MARPRKEGLDYFPCVTNFDRDLRSVFISYGAEARSVWLTIMQECYRSGNARIALTDSIIATLARESEVTPDSLKILLRAFCDAGIFSLQNYLDGNEIYSHGAEKGIAEILHKLEEDRERKRLKRRRMEFSTGIPESSALKERKLKESK